MLCGVTGWRFRQGCRRRWLREAEGGGSEQAEDTVRQRPTESVFIVF